MARATNGQQMALQRLFFGSAALNVASSYYIPFLRIPTQGRKNDTPVIAHNEVEKCIFILQKYSAVSFDLHAYAALQTRRSSTKIP